MKFLLHAQVDQQSIGKRLGSADYSYFFLLRAFAGVLAELGEVIELDDPAHADAIHAQAQAMGERCLLLSFAPPHKTPLGLNCPVVPVFAWEYPDIPGQIEETCWKNDRRNDWRYVFARTGRAIALSSHTVEAVQRSMGAAYPIAAIPAPVRTLAPAAAPARVPVPAQGALLRVHASVADSRRMGLDVNSLIYFNDDDGTPHEPHDDQWLPASAVAPDRSDDPADGHGDDLGAIMLAHEHLPVGCGWDLPPVMSILTRLHGVVYTSVLIPSAGRKNWEDLISAFCWAFRDVADATLVLKLGGDDLVRHHHKLLMLLSKMAPLKCRVIAINGYLTDEEYAALIGVTTYYVNTSLGEGLCLPLVEFLAAGVPAVAPDNTAMADYITDELAFVVASYPGIPTVWPHGDDEVNRTTYHQLDWASLVAAYRESHAAACNDTARYQRMSTRAMEAMREYGGPGVTRERLRAFLCPELPPLRKAARPAAMTP